MNRKQRGFTLVELIVVIAIIVILAGLIMAVINRAKSDAAETVCLSNLRQLGEAELIYAQDYNGYFPPYLNTLPGAENDCSAGITLASVFCSPDKLQNVLQPMIHNRDIWFCPNDLMAKYPVEKNGVYHLYSSYFFDNFFNQNYKVAIRNIYTNIDPTSIMIIEDPYITIRNNYHNCPLQYNVGHMGGINRCFLDGHVKWGPCYP